MRAQVLERPRSELVLRELAPPVLGPEQVRIQVSACGVCRTDLHVLDWELPRPKLPLVLGHQVVGTVVERGEAVTSPTIGDRVGIPWLGWTDGTCARCRSGRENLCAAARFTGYTLDGGYAEQTVADARFCFPLPPGLDDAHTAPLLCAGLIGYRALRLAGDAPRIGFYGFGASAHLLAQVVVAQGRELFAFTRDGDLRGQAFARERGAVWAGGSSERPPVPLDAAIIFASAGDLVVRALAALSPGGTVVCAGIHMSDIPSFPYDLLWEERSIRSVANLTREDGREFLPLAARLGVVPEVTVFRLEQANEALLALREGRFTGAAVLQVAG
ncbi:MAG TPA: zinc-dependent alcohol dehydrogenase family protein [Myxococcaceae bacterium]|nr:zinc-dependent alcohol dehydrogenase family protein [Myxococcaceae bacterium]